MSKRLLKEIRRAATRQGRRKSGMFVCEGMRVCTEALRRRPDWISDLLATDSFAESQQARPLLQLADTAGVRVTTVNEDEYSACAATENPQGVTCLCRRPPGVTGIQSIRDPFILVLDRLNDPGNLGTILRTAWAAGLKGTWCIQGTTDPFGPKAVRAGMGAQFNLKINTVDDLETAATQLHEEGRETIWISDPAQGVPLYDPAFDLAKSALVIGSEAHGAEKLTTAKKVRIPMPGHAESLNAAQAATLLIYEAVRRKILT